MNDIKGIIDSVIKNLSGANSHQISIIQDAWKRILNKKELLHCNISHLKDNHLIVNVDSSAWLYQFNLKKNKIVQDLNKTVPEVENIFFKIGKVS